MSFLATNRISKGDAARKPTRSPGKSRLALTPEVNPRIRRKVGLTVASISNSPVDREISGKLAAYGWIAYASDRRAGPPGGWAVEEATFAFTRSRMRCSAVAAKQIKSNSVRNLFREIGGALHEMWLPSRDTVTGSAAFHFNRRMGRCATLGFPEWRERHVPQSDTAAERSFAGLHQVNPVWAAQSEVFAVYVGDSGVSAPHACGGSRSRFPARQSSPRRQSPRRRGRAAVKSYGTIVEPAVA